MLTEKQEREKALEEQKSKEAESRLLNPDLSEELDKLRLELGGPFFTDEENKRFNDSVKKAKKDFDQIKPKKDKDKGKEESK